jgi:uncharacterized OB-fold protein
VLDFERIPLAGTSLTAQLTDMGEEHPRIGMSVEMVIRKIREDDNEREMTIYGYKFQPAVRA